MAPDHLLAPQANNGDDNLPLLAWRPASHEETPAKFRRAKGEPRDYAADFAKWRAAHPEIAASLLQWAVDAIRLGVRRVEVNVLFAEARRVYGITANNSHRAAAADWLIAQEPRLADLIERRRRKVTR